MTFTKGNQIEHIYIYKSLVQYRLRFGVNGSVFFRKSVKITKLRENGVRDRAEAEQYIKDLKTKYAEKGFKLTRRLQKFCPTKRAYYLLTKKPYLARETEKSKMVFKHSVPILRASRPISKYVGGHNLRPVRAA